MKFLRATRNLFSLIILVSFAINAFSAPDKFISECATSTSQNVNATPAATDMKTKEATVVEDITSSIFNTEKIQLVDSHIVLNVKNDVAVDNIYLKDGRVFPIQYLSETGLSVKFKKFDDPINRTWKKEKAKIAKIVMADGSVKQFGETTNTNYQSPQSSINKEESAAIAGVLGVILLAIGAAFVVGIIAVLAFFNWL